MNGYQHATLQYDQAINQRLRKTLVLVDTSTLGHIVAGPSGASSLAQQAPPRPI